MVRRYGIAYEAVTGEGLAPEPNAGRLYPERVVTVLEQARDLVKDTPGLAVEDAIRSILGMATTPTAPARARDASGVTSEHLELIVTELRGLRDEMRELRQENQSLHALVENQGEQLKALTAPSDTPSGDKAEYVAEMEQIHTNKDLEEERKRVKELNRRIEYLQRELERRSTGSEQASRPWWRRLFG